MADDLELSVLEAPQAFAKDSLIGELTTLICPGQKHGEITGHPLVAAKTGDGVHAALAGKYLAWVNFMEKPCRDEAFFAGSIGSDVPVFPGVSRLSKDGWSYAVQGDALEGAILEPRGIVRISAGRPEAEVRIEAVPGGAVYATNPGKGSLNIEWGTGPEARKLSLKPGEIRLLAD